MKKMFLYIVLILTLCVLAGCSQEKMDEKAKEYVLKEATHKAIQYMNSVKKKEIVLISHEFEQDNEKSLIHLNGYEVTSPETTLKISIDYNDNFKIIQP